MNKKYCISKKTIFLGFVLILAFLYVLFSWNQSNYKNSVNTKAANVDLLEKLKKTNKDYLSACTKYSGNSYLGCIYEKSHIEKGGVNAIGKPILYYKGKILDKPQEFTNVVSDKSANREIDIGPLFVSSDLSQQFAERIQSLILNSWSNEQINKKIVMSDKKIYRFDSTTITDCYFDEYWSNIRIYYPNAFCEAFKTKRPVAFLRMGYGGEMSVGNENYIWGDTVGDLGTLEYTIKHELGHVLGSWDNDDYSSVQGNALFPDGTAREDGDPYYDIMIYPVTYVKDFTRLSINNSQVGAFFDPYPFWQKNIMIVGDKGETLGNKAFYLFAGVRSANHVPGTITDKPVCTGFTDANGLINLQTACPEFFEKKSENKYIAGFLSIDLYSKTYKGSFDIIDVVMSTSKNEPYHTVTVEYKPIMIDVATPVVAPAPVEFVTLTNDSLIRSLKTIRIAVRTVSYLEFHYWNLCYSISETGPCKSLMTKSDLINENSPLDIPMPDELKRYQGNLNLKITGTYSIRPIQKQVTYVSEIKTKYEDKPYIESVAMQRDVLTVKGDGFYYYQNPAEIIMDGKSFSQEKDFKFNEYTNNRLQAPIESGLGNSIHSVKIIRDGIPSQPYEFIPGIDNDVLGINVPIGKFVIDPEETVIVHMEADCKKSLSNLIFGIDTTNALFNNEYQFKKKTCSDKERIIYNFKIPAQRIFDKYFNSNRKEDDMAMWYGCSIQIDANNLHFNEQTPQIISLFKLKKGNGLFYNCVIGEVGFEKRVYN